MDRTINLNYCKVTGKLKSGEIVEINSRDLHPLQGNDK